MKPTRAIIFIGILIIYRSTIFCQVDSSGLEFFPLHKGDLWQYSYFNDWGPTPFFRNQQVEIADTLMPNGRHYAKVSGSPYGNSIKYFRIDSLLRVQEYGKDAYRVDSTVLINDEVNIFRLNEPDSSVWKIGYDIVEQMYHIPYLFRYNGRFNTYAFGGLQEVMLFQEGFFETVSQRSLFAGRCVLMKGLGLYELLYGENLSLRLTGAIINGKKYGDIRTGVDEGEQIPAGFSLDQNYPNPANPSTTISFTLPSRSLVTLKIFDVMGRDVAMVVNEELSAGSYSRVWNAGAMPSGVYFFRLQAGTYTDTKRLLILK